MNLFINKESECKKNIDLLDMLSQIINTNKPYLLRGGLAIALYYKKIYRCHKDIDLYFDQKDFNFWKIFFSKEYIIRKVKLPANCKETMYALYKQLDLFGHIIFIRDLNNKKDVISQVYSQKKYSNPKILEKYSQYIPLTKEAIDLALSNFEEPVMEIELGSKKVNILNIKYLKEQKIFGILYRGKEEDEDMKYYFNCVI